MIKKAFAIKGAGNNLSKVIAGEGSACDIRRSREVFAYS